MATQPVMKAPAEAPRWRGLVRSFLRSDEIGILAAFIVLCFALAVTTDTFLNPMNLMEVSRQASFIGIMTVGMVFVLSMGDVDLSVGAIYMLAPTFAGVIMGQGVNPYLAAVLGILLGGLCGFINGGLSVLLRIPTIIITLGTMTIYRAIGLVICNGVVVHNFPKDNLLVTVGGSRIFGLPTSTVVWIALVIIGHVVYTNTPFGHRVRAIGGNLQAARFAGVQVNKHRLMVLTLQGMLCAVSGILLLAFLEAVDPSTGQGYELLVIASTIIGGTAMSGGVGTVLGGMLGALIIAVLRNGLVLWGVNIYWTGAATGAVIIAAVTIDYLIKRRRMAR